MPATADPLDDLRPGVVLTVEHLVAIETLRARAEPAWQTRGRRLAARDRALRRAAHALGVPGITIASRTLARLMAGARVDAPAEVHDHLRDALRLNGARALGWRQIAKILDDGDRG